MQLSLGHGRVLPLDRPRIVGVLNVTPDSFSDGGRFADVDAAVAQARRMLAEGADVLDVGGESTRPGARRIDADEQIARVSPVIEQIIGERRTPAGDVPIVSIDTTRRAVAEAALDAGAMIVNDVSAGREDPDMFRLVSERTCPLILMHMLGQPATMQNDPRYDDVVAEVRQFLIDRAEAGEAAGIDRANLVIDPGLGFGKTTEHNLQLIAGLDRFVEAGYPVLLGASRKRFLGAITGIAQAAKRDPATAALTAIAVAKGVRLIRVHHVAANRQAADVAFACQPTRSPEGA